jgi:hypothetical protein
MDKRNQLQHAKKQRVHGMDVVGSLAENAHVSYGHDKREVELSPHCGRVPKNFQGCIEGFTSRHMLSQA